MIKGSQCFLVTILGCHCTALTQISHDGPLQWQLTVKKAQFSHPTLITIKSYFINYSLKDRVSLDRLHAECRIIGLKQKKRTTITMIIHLHTKNVH